jgi:4-amino-4-deoxy-L-arabinose transferase-like glycosyltransferase
VSVGFIFLMAREWFNERAAWLAAGLAALTGLFTFYEALILQAAVDPVLTSGGLLALTLALRPESTARHRTAWMVAAGTIFGLASLNRPNMSLAIAGVVPGIALAYAAGRSMEALLAGVKPADAPTMIAAVGLSVLMTLVGSVMPTLRALRVDPITALRAE